MTDEDLALIRERVAAGLGLSYPRVEQLLEALDEAWEVAQVLWNNPTEYECYALERKYPRLKSSQAVNKENDRD